MQCTNTLADTEAVMSRDLCEIAFILDNSGPWQAWKAIPWAVLTKSAEFPTRVGWIEGPNVNSAAFDL